MREELFWDRNMDDASAEIIIERAINFGGFDFIDEVQRKYGMKRFIIEKSTEDLTFGLSLNGRLMVFPIRNVGTEQELSAHA